MKFPCTACGACCRNVGKSILLAKLLIENGSTEPVALELANFPFTPDEFGACPMLVDNKCSIYKNRPDVCNVQTIWRKHLKGKITQKKYYELNQQMCERLGG